MLFDRKKEGKIYKIGQFDAKNQVKSNGDL